MNLQDAINDTNRPLSITPREWMHAVEASLAEEAVLVDEVVEREKKKIDIKKSDDDWLLRIDVGLDQMIQGIRIVYSGLADLNSQDLSVDEGEFYRSFKDVFDNAIVPYSVEAIELIEKQEKVDK